MGTPACVRAAVVGTAMVLTGTLAAGGAASADTAPNGSIAFSAWNDVGYDIYTTDPAQPDAPPVQLTTDGRYNGNADWSPDGSKIVFDGWSTFGGPRIQVMDVDPTTADQTVLTDPCPDASCYGDFQPAWSPDGTRIGFVSSRPDPDGAGGWTYELYVMDAAGEVGDLPQATRLTTDDANEWGKSETDSHITWSPDGSRIAFLSTGRGINEDACDIWMMDSQDLDGDGFGDNLQQLTFDESFNCSAFEDVTPSWSPNSSLIAFSSVRTGYWDIWLVNADNPTDLRNVTSTSGEYEDQPSWSPDGTQIIYRKPADGYYQVFSLPVPPPAAAKVAATAAVPTQLTFDPLNKSEADWGPAEGDAPTTGLVTVGAHRNGTISSTPKGIRCGTNCEEAYALNSTVTLKATPLAGYAFKKWTAGCTGKATTCTVTVTGDLLVEAKFVKVG